MKKEIILFIIGMLCFGLTGFAQDEAEEKTKDFDALKPKQGDFAIGTDLIPYINFAGNFFGKENDNDLSLNETILYGKYMLFDNAAIRVGIYLNNYTDTDRAYVDDDAALAVDLASTAQVEDIRIRNNADTRIFAGYEMRKDRDRFTFLYGGNLYYRYYRFDTEYQYGNPINELNSRPSISSLGSYYSGSDARLLYSDNGITHTFGIGAFAGIEYFLAKKLAIGADFSVTYSLTSSTQADAQYEEWDGTQVYVFDRPSSPGSSYRGLSSSQYNSYVSAGQIYIHFYF